MSAQFILEYGGMPIRFTSAGATPCPEYQADKFIAEADAWLTAHANGLNPAHCRVVNLYERNLSPVRRTCGADQIPKPETAP